VSPERTVVFIQEWLPRYRLPFFNLLRDLLGTRRIELRLYCGQPAGAQARRSNAAGLPWAHQVVNSHLGPLVWQPVWRQAQRADLVIAEQGNRLALNYLLLATRPAGGARVAFFGHGVNLQGNLAGLREHWRRILARTPNWWFAYTDGAADRIVSAGFPANRMTVVQNAVDTSGLTEVDIPKRPGRCIYVGSLYEAKRLRLLLEAADSIAANVPQFELIVVGDGPLRPWLQSEAEIRPWLRHEGPSHGLARDELFVSSELTLVPGSVGLVVVDSFAARAPLVTMDDVLHGPEIEYIQDGVNGRLLATGSAEQYAEAITQLLMDRALRDTLVDGCVSSSRKYTIEAMTANFASGIMAALAMPVTHPE
jgi:glycosyltransferase involved in cell wall biosynthesis